MNDTSGSITKAISQAAQLNEAAIQLLRNRYFEKLCRFAEQKTAQRHDRFMDANGIAEFAMDTLFKGLNDGRFHEIKNGDELWELLIMLVSKETSQRSRFFDQKDQRSLINNICDQFVSKLKSGSTADIAAHFESAKDGLVKGNSNDSAFGESLLLELVLLRIAYSTDRKATVESLKSQYPHLSKKIEIAVENEFSADLVNSHASMLDSELRGLSETQAVASQEHPTASELQHEEPARPHLRQIGSYKLLEQIGEGGMGTVWMAEQEKPVRRRVAIKLIKSGFADKQAIARFEAERQALAMMDHPNIAKVLDAGASEQGSPYFVMELVKGDPITKYCDTHRLTPDERLMLFLQACDAVQHAHHKGIIHRDIKPSNILVHIHNGKPTVKVIDFGLAKALDHQTKLSDKSMITDFGTVLGTVQYMSPEQARLNEIDVDTRTDIYSLGVILYELLTGSTPVEKETLTQNSLLDVLQIIREQDPPRPSNRLNSLSVDQRNQIGAERQSQPSKLKQILRGDLDWIVMRALDSDRARRYSTPNDFSEDIRRYMSGDAVVARPPSTGYRLRKFSRKNKLPVAIVAGLFAVVAGAAITIAGALTKANVARAEAESSSERSEKILQFVTESFSAANPNSGATAEMSAKDVLEIAQSNLYESELDDLGKMRLLWQLSNSFAGLGEFQLSLQAAEESRELSLTALGPDHLDTFTSMHKLAHAYYLAGRTSEAIELFRKTLELRTSKLGSSHPETLNTMTGLSTAMFVGGMSQEAIELYEKAIVLSEDQLGSDHPNTLGLMNRLAFAYNEVGKTNEAIELFQETLTLRQAILEVDHPETFWSMDGLAFAYTEAGRTEDAIELHEKTLKMRTVKLGLTHPNTLRSMLGLANAYDDAGRTKEAIELHEKTLELKKDRLGPNHPDTFWSMNNLANSYGDAGRSTDAIELYQRTLELQTLELGKDHRSTLWSMDGLANAYAEVGQTDKAIELHKQNLELRTSKLGPDHIATLTSMNGLANVFAYAGRNEEAVKLYHQSFQSQRKQFGMDSQKTQQALTRLIATLAMIRPADDRLNQELMNLMRQVCDNSRKGEQIRALAAAEYRLGNFDEAISVASGSTETNQACDHPTNYAILALSHFKLENQQDANRFRQQHGRLLKDKAFSDDKERLFFAAEVDDLFGKSKDAEN